LQQNISHPKHPVPAYNGSLVSFKDLSLLNNSDLPAGEYNITFAIDNNGDSVLDKTFSQEITIKVKNDEDCRRCHESVDRPDPTDIPSRHHALINSGGLGCLDCHNIITNDDGSSTLNIIRTCSVCHNQPEQMRVTYQRPIPDESLTQRHHQRASNEGWDCVFCHTSGQ